MPTPLNTLIGVAKFTINLTCGFIIHCNEPEEALTLFDTLLNNFELLHLEAGDLDQQDKLQFESIIKNLLQTILTIEDRVESPSIDKKAITILAFSTVMQFLSSTPQYIHFFQNKHAILINLLNKTIESYSHIKNTAIQQHALAGLACFCHIMHTQTKLLYLKKIDEYYLFFHTEAITWQLVKKMIDLKNDWPELSRYVTSGIHEISCALISLKHAQLMLNKTTPQNNVLFNSFINNIKAFIKETTHDFIEEKLEKISTTEALHQFSHTYTALTQAPYKHSEGKAQLQYHIMQELLLQFGIDRDQDAIQLGFYNVLDQDSAWPHIASTEARNMQNRVRRVITETKGYQAWMRASMQTQVSSPALFYISPTNQLNKNTTNPPNSLDAYTPNP